MFHCHEKIKEKRNYFPISLLYIMTRKRILLDEEEIKKDDKKIFIINK